MKDREQYSFLQIVLTVLFVSCLLISNIIVFKNLKIVGGISITCGDMVFPVTYIISDIFSEVYGYKWSRISCYLAFAMNVLMVAAFMVSVAAPYPDYWTDQEAFATVLGFAPRALFASLAAFLAGDFVNDTVFEKMKKKDGRPHFGKRALLSSLCGDCVDSLIVNPIMFIGTMPASALIILIVTQVLVKMAFETIALPVTKIVLKHVYAYEEGEARQISAI